MRAYLLGATLALLAGAGASQAPAPPPEQDDQDIVVHGFRPDIYVRGHRPPPHCVQRPGDPLDAIEVGSAALQRVVAPDRRGILRARLDDNPITGPDYWQRAGNAIASYLYRSPSDGTPLCIGARGHPNGWGQLRRILDATPFHGKAVRFTALVATRDAEEVRLWLAAGDSHVVMRGGDSRLTPLRGTHGWTPMTLTITDIPGRATKLSYGFLLFGVGDVWMAEPRIEIIDAREAGPPMPLVPYNGH